METLELDVKKYEEIHQENEYKLASTADIYIPWFMCTLKCRYEKIRSMSELDKIFCMCIDKGIDSCSDISFVLSLEEEICKGELERLVSGNILTECDDKYQFTEAGLNCFNEKKRTDIETKEYSIAVNAITGEWRIDNIDFQPESTIGNSGIKLFPIKTVVKQDIENDDELRRALGNLFEANVIKYELLDYKTISFDIENILFYTNDKGDILFEIYNIQEKELDIGVASSLRKKYEKREILELMEAEKHLKVAEKELLKNVKKDHPKAKNPVKTGLCYMRNQEIRELFLKELDVASMHLFIISPWITDFVVDETMIDKFESVLKRGVHVEIGFGYASLEKMKWKLKKYKEEETNAKSEKELIKIRGKRDKDKECKSWDMALMLQEKFRKYKQFEIFYVNEGTHEKVLCYDDESIFIGSFNLLSYDGGEQENYSGFKFRYEGGALIKDREFALSVIKDFKGSKRLLE